MHRLPAGPGELFRLATFRVTHPEVVIGDAGFGAWQARIPTDNGETVTVRHTLRELLDRLDELVGGAVDQV